MNKCNFPQQAAKSIQQKFPDFKPRIGIVLGSGLGKLTEQLEDKQTISYEELPGFPQTSVEGHEGSLHLGHIGGVSLVCLEGRAHTYESGSYDEVKTYVRTLKLLGCDYFLATNASGSLRKEVGPGELVLVSDHINFQISNPLIGPNDDEFGPRFPPLDKTYDESMREVLLEKAKELNIKLHDGVYISVMGPSYETSAEIRAFRLLGADLVGMSTVPEVLVANHCGLKIAVVATITNYATDLASTSHSHDEVVQMANTAAEKLQQLVVSFVKSLA